MKTEKIVLAIETSLKQGSLTLFCGGDEIGDWQGTESVSRSEDLVLGIQQLFDKNRLNIQQLDLIAASLGPGSFTGLRVGLAIAKGLNLATNCQLRGVSILSAMAFYQCQQINLSPINLFCVVSAGRGHLYYQTFTIEKQLIRRYSEIQITPENMFYEKLSGERESIVITEANMELALARVKELGFELINIKESMAKYIGQYALSKYIETGEVQKFSPIYVREV